MLVKEKKEHDRWLGILEREFNREGFKTIREGKMFFEDNGFKTPDLFVLRDNRLFLVLEVIASPSYERNKNSVLNKVKRIKQRYCLEPVIIFEPVKYMDKKFWEQRKEHYWKYYTPKAKSFRDIEKHCAEQWKEKEDIKVEFWNEDTYKLSIKNLTTLETGKNVIKLKWLGPYTMKDRQKLKTGVKGSGFYMFLSPTSESGCRPLYIGLAYYKSIRSRITSHKAPTDRIGRFAFNHKIPIEEIKFKIAYFTEGSRCTYLNIENLLVISAQPLLNREFKDCYYGGRLKVFNEGNCEPLKPEIDSLEYESV